MKQFYNLTKQYIIFPIKSIVLVPLWLPKRVNHIKFIGISMLLWSISLVERYQENKEIPIGNTITVIWIVLVVIAAFFFILNNSKEN